MYVINVRLHRCKCMQPQTRRCVGTHVDVDVCTHVRMFVSYVCLCRTADVHIGVRLHERMVVETCICSCGSSYVTVCTDVCVCMYVLRLHVGESIVCMWLLQQLRLTAEQWSGERRASPRVTLGARTDEVTCMMTTLVFVLF